MAYNSSEIFRQVDEQLSVNPAVRLCELERMLKCSHPTIEKAVLILTGLTFRKYKNKILLEKGVLFLRQGYKAKEIGSLLGYKWSEHFLRLVKKCTGCSLSKLSKTSRY